MSPSHQADLRFVLGLLLALAVLAAFTLCIHGTALPATLAAR